MMNMQICTRGKDVTFIQVCVYMYRYVSPLYSTHAMAQAFMVVYLLTQVISFSIVSILKKPLQLKVS